MLPCQFIATIQGNTCTLSNLYAYFAAALSCALNPFADARMAAQSDQATL